MFRAHAESLHGFLSYRLIPILFYKAPNLNYEKFSRTKSKSIQTRILGYREQLPKKICINF
jgi:hypothetical protein